MENLFNYITGFEMYFLLLEDTEEAAELMKQEIQTETYQRDRCVSLRNECIDSYTHLFLHFNQDLNRLRNELAIEISKRDTKGQELLYAQIFNRMYEFKEKIIAKHKMKNFSDEPIGKKTKKLKAEKSDGGIEEKDMEYNFSLAMLARDLLVKFNEFRIVIENQFKFLDLKKDTVKKEISKRKLKGHSVALFCSILNESGLVPKGMDSNEVYCNKIISDFNIHAPIKTRQYFRETMELRKSDKYLKEVQQKILPEIPLEVREKIVAYINHKLAAQDNKKLYA